MTTPAPPYRCGACGSSVFRVHTNEIGMPHDFAVRVHCARCDRMEGAPDLVSAFRAIAETKTPEGQPVKKEEK